MLNNFYKNASNIIKLLPIKIFKISAKTVTLIGLGIYWSVIIVGTFLQIN